MWVAKGACVLPFATVRTPGATPLLIGFYYLGCVPAAIAENLCCEERWPLWGGLLLVWSGAWVALVSLG